MLDTVNLQWVKPLINGEAPSPRFYHAATRITGNKILILGGVVNFGKKNKRLYIL